MLQQNPNSDYLQYPPDNATGFTPSQLGIPFAQKVFNNQNLIPGAAAAIAQNPPFQFWSNGQQIALPPENTIVGGSVPTLPPDLQVRYAASFMGYPIPVNMLRVVVVNGQLEISPWQITTDPNAYFSQDATIGAATNAALVANNKVLLNILMSVVGNLVNSYSSTPYANDLNKLSHYILDLRNKQDFLKPVDTKTAIGYFLQADADIFNKYVAPIGKAVINTIIAPGTGAGNILNPFIAAGQPSAVTPPPLVQPAPQIGAVSSKVILYVILAILVYLIIYLIIKNSKGNGSK